MNLSRVSPCLPSANHSWDGLQHFQKMDAWSNLHGVSPLSPCLSLAGFLYDYTQTYDCSFYLAGLCYLLSSLSLFMEPLAQRWKARSKLSHGSGSSGGGVENSCRTNGCFTPDRLQQNGAV